jgi:hypothetical protein
MTDNVVAKPDFLKDEDSLKEIATLDDAFKLLASQGLNVTEIKDLGSGFVVVDDKSQLVGKSILILGGQFNEGDNGRFVSLYVVDGDGGKWIVNDGGTGIFAQAEKYAAKGLLSGLIVRKGLTRSDYKYTDEKDGKEKNATTFYLSSV